MTVVRGNRISVAMHRMNFNLIIVVAKRLPKDCVNPGLRKLVFYEYGKFLVDPTRNCSQSFHGQFALAETTINRRPDGFVRQWRESVITMCREYGLYRSSLCHINQILDHTTSGTCQ